MFLCRVLTALAARYQYCVPEYVFWLPNRLPYKIFSHKMNHILETVGMVEKLYIRIDQYGRHR